jgi:hypothetical protein
MYFTPPLPGTNPLTDSLMFRSSSRTGNHYVSYTSSRHPKAIDVHEPHAAMYYTQSTRSNPWCGAPTPTSDGLSCGYVLYPKHQVQSLVWGAYTHAEKADACQRHLTFVFPRLSQGAWLVVYDVSFPINPQDSGLHETQWADFSRHYLNSAPLLHQMSETPSNILSAAHKK